MRIIILLKTDIYFYINSFSVIRIQFQYKTIKLLLHSKFQYFVLNLLYLYIKFHSVTLFLKFNNICNLKVSYKFKDILNTESFKNVSNPNIRG